MIFFHTFMEIETVTHHDLLANACPNIYLGSDHANQQLLKLHRDYLPIAEFSHIFITRPQSGSPSALVFQQPVSDEDKFRQGVAPFHLCLR